MKVATICFPIQGDTIFLANKKRSFGAGHLNGWGGKVDGDESIAATASRELFEESTIETDPADMELVAIIDFFEETNHIFECHVFFVRQWQGTLQETEEMGIPEQFPLDSVPYERMWKSDHLWMPLICEGKKIRAKAIYKKGMAEVERFECYNLYI